MTLLHIIAGLLRFTSVAAGLLSFDVFPDLAHQLNFVAIPVLLVLLAVLYGLVRALLTKRPPRADESIKPAAPRKQDVQQTMRKRVGEVTAKHK